MNDEQLQIVSYDQAKQLKKIGFNWKTDFFYCKKGFLHRLFTPQRNTNISRIDETHISAPSASLSLKFFRDVKKLRFTISEFDGWYRYIISGQAEHAFCSKMLPTYEKAESELLTTLLTLIDPNNEP